MKHKLKPVARAEIRERVEKKFRARGALAFHLLLILGAGILLLYNMPELLSARGFSTRFQDFFLLYGVFGLSGALHFIRYHFRHGRGRDRHERATEERVSAQLRSVGADEAEEQEELVRLQMDDRLKNRRLVWQHIVIYIGIVGMLLVVYLENAGVPAASNWAIWQGLISFAAIWGIGLAAHLLRFTFAYGSMSAQRREAKIEAQVARELARERRRSAATSARAERREGSRQSADDSELVHALSLDDLEAMQERPGG